MTTETHEATAPQLSPDADDTAAPGSPQASDAPPVEPTGGLDKQPITLADITGLHVETLPDFDPAIHAVDADGKPRRRGDGSLALKRGRKPGGLPRPAGGAPQKPDTQATPEYKEADEAAKTAANLTIWGGVAIFGDDFRPEKGEPEMLHHAYRDYFAAKGVTKLPPEMALVVALAAYTLPRLSKPTTKTRLQTIALKARGFFAKFRKSKSSRGDAIKNGTAE